MFTWFAESALMSSPIGAFLRLVGGALKGFFSSLNAQGWLGLIGCAALGWVALHQWGEARHWKKQSGQFEKLYRADEADLQRIATQATALKAKTDALTANITKTLKEKNDADNARVAADADAVRVRGPGKAACPRSASAPGVASRRNEAAPAAAPAGPQVPAGDWAAVPWIWLVTVVEEHDQLLNDEAIRREADKQNRAAWPKSEAPKP